MDNFNQKLGQRIKELRLKYKYSQEDLASILSIPRPSYGQIEKGMRKVSAEELVLISQFFNLNVSLLLDFPQDKNDPSESSELKIYFFRHGEALDDLYNQYGGWFDPELSAKGINKAYTIVQNLKDKNIKFDTILTSPLKRAKTTAEIMARELNSEIKVTQYLKERNTYGLLCGMDKEVAKRNFPELVTAYDAGDYVLGSERYEDFVSRLTLLFNFLRNYQVKNINTIACVTHGKLIAAIIKEFLKMNIDQLDDGSILVIGLKGSEMHYIQSEGITFKKREE